MVVTTAKTYKPLGFIGEWTLGIGAGNQHEFMIGVAFVTDLIIKVENTHASAEMTISVDWCMTVNEADGLIDAIGSTPAITFGNQDMWRFSDKFFNVNDTVVTYTPVDPYYENVLPCNWIKLGMYGTVAASQAKVWIQGIKKKL